MPDVLAATVREEWGRLVALLLAQYRRVDLVEDALGDAVEAAARRWPEDGVPDNPAAWLLTAARRRLLDRLRAEETARRSTSDLALEAGRRQEGARTMVDPGDLVEDDLLRLVLMCAHPALSPEAAGALTLRLVLGVPTADVARLFLVPEATMAARLTRAKKKIVGAAIPFGVPDASVLPERLDEVARVAYLAFTAGYAPGTGPDLLRAETSGEAIRLVRVVLGVRPDEPVLVALLALMLLQHSRRDARVADGHLVLLPDQDRTRWHHDEIAEALALLDHPGLAGPITVQAASYTLQARIAAEHARAARPKDTRWERVVDLYDTLLAGRSLPRRPPGPRRGGRRGLRSGRGDGRPRGGRDPGQPPRRGRAGRPPGAPGGHGGRAGGVRPGDRRVPQRRRARLPARAARGPSAEAYASPTACCLASTVRPSSTTNPRARSSSCVDPDPDTRRHHHALVEDRVAHDGALADLHAVHEDRVGDLGAVLDPHRGREHRLVDGPAADHDARGEDRVEGRRRRRRWLPRPAWRAGAGRSWCRSARRCCRG